MTNFHPCYIIIKDKGETMYTVKIVRRIHKIGTLTRIKEETYEIPTSIICPQDGHIMNYNSHFRAYRCTCDKCNNWISGEDYVMEQLAQAQAEDIEDYSDSFDEDTIETAPF